MIKTATPAVDKTVAILDFLAKNDHGVNFTQIFSSLNLPKSSTSVLISSLKSHGIIREYQGKFFLSLKLTSWGNKAIDQFNIKDLAQPILKELTNRTSLTSHLGVLAGDLPSYLLKEQSPYAVIVNSYIGKILPLNSTALGKVFLAYLDEKEADFLIAKQLPFKSYTKNTITDLDELKKSVLKVKKQGYALDLEEDCDGVICLAAPVLDDKNNIRAAISISGVLQQYKERPVKMQIPLLLEAAQQLGNLFK